MDDLNLLLRYATRLLIWIAPLEFVCGRAISRAAKQMPAGATGAAIFGVISNVGAFLVMPAFLLVLAVLALGAVLALRGPAPGPADGAGRSDEFGGAWPRPLAALVLLFLVLSLGLLVPGAPGALLFLYNGVSAALMLSIAGLGVRRAQGRPALRVTLALYGLAYAGYYLYALGAILAQGTPDAGGGDLGVWANDVGEAFGMAGAISLLWTSGLLRPTLGAPQPRPLWLSLAGLAGAVVLAGPLFEQWLQGVITQFSVGFTLFLPVPITALALAAWVYAVCAANSRAARSRTGLPWAWDFGAALLLLPAAGYQLQLNYQHLLLAAVLLLAGGLLRPLSGPARAAPAPAARPAAHAAPEPGRLL